MTPDYLKERLPMPFVGPSLRREGGTGTSNVCLLQRLRFAHGAADAERHSLPQQRRADAGGDGR